MVIPSSYLRRAVLLSLCSTILLAAGLAPGSARAIPVRFTIGATADVVDQVWAKQLGLVDGSPIRLSATVDPTEVTVDSWFVGIRLSEPGLDFEAGDLRLSTALEAYGSTIDDQPSTNCRLDCELADGLRISFEFEGDFGLLRVSTLLVDKTAALFTGNPREPASFETIEPSGNVRLSLLGTGARGVSARIDSLRVERLLVPVPEPATALLLGLGLLGLTRRR